MKAPMKRTNVRTSPSELLIRQRLTALSRTLPGARKGDVHAVHQARVATRRIREALPLIARGRSGKSLKKSVRKLTRALGPVRELDVALLNLDQLRTSGEVSESAIARLRQLITEERQRLGAEMVRRISQYNLPKLQRRAVEAASRGTPDKNSTRDPRRAAAAMARAARRAVALRAAIENAAGIYLPDRLHEVRIAVKKLRYALEIARDLGGSRATARIRTLKRVQDLLGRMHDLEMLIARTRAIQSAGAPNLKLSGDLDRLVRRLENECRRLHVRYMNERKALRGICDYVTAREARIGTASAA
jgi:CHAD domain-containing protein